MSNQKPPASHSKRPWTLPTAILILRFAVTIVLLILIFSRTDLSALGGALIGVDVRWFLIGLLTAFASVAMNTYRWMLLLRILGHERRYVRLLMLQLYGTFFNNVLPTSIGGDAVRAYYASRGDPGGGRIGLPDVLASIFVQRLTGFVTLIVLSGALLLALPGALPRELPDDLAPVLSGLNPRDAAMVLLAGFGAILLTVGCVSFSRRIMSGFRAGLEAIRLGGLGEKVGRLAEAVRRFRGHPFQVARVLGVALVFQVTTCLSVYLLGLSLGIDKPPWYYLLCVPLISMAMMGPSIGGHGLRELAFGILFIAAGKEKALSLSILYLACASIAGLIGGLAYAASGVRREAIWEWSRQHEEELTGTDKDQDDG